MLYNMISNIQNVKKARELRLAGKSLSEISKELAVATSTLSMWLKDIVLTEPQQQALKARVKNKMNRGRLNAMISRKSARIFKEKTIYEQAEKELESLRKDPFFVLGLALYWMNGAQKGAFQFSNSDPEAILKMSISIKKYLNAEDSIIKQRNYNGHLRVDISRIDVLRRVIAWQKQLIKYYASIANV